VYTDGHIAVILEICVYYKYYRNNTKVTNL